MLIYCLQLETLLGRLLSLLIAAPVPLVVFEPFSKNLVTSPQLGVGHISFHYVLETIVSFVVLIDVRYFTYALKIPKVFNVSPSMPVGL